MQTGPELPSRTYGKIKRRDAEILVWSLRQAIIVLQCSVCLLPSLPMPGPRSWCDAVRTTCFLSQKGQVAGGANSKAVKSCQAETGRKLLRRHWKIFGAEGGAWLGIQQLDARCTGSTRRYFEVAGDQETLRDDEMRFGDSGLFNRHLHRDIWA